MDDLIFVYVHNFHVKRPQRTATVTRAAVILFDSPVYLEKDNFILYVEFENIKKMLMHDFVIEYNK